MTYAYRIELWRGRDRQWYWHIKHRNGQIMVVSEGYRRKSSAIRSARRLRDGMATATMVEVTK